MEKHEVVPDIIDVVPEHVAEIAWSDDVMTNMGNELTPTQVKLPPTNISWPSEPNALYTLVLIDPDAPSRKDRSVGEVLHWLVINIPGCQVNQGQVHAEHIGSGPREGSGLHRYIFLVYRQPGHMTPPSGEDAYRPRNSERRIRWNARRFASEHDLGKPVAANFYVAQYDDYVPTFYKELHANDPQ
ncbi:protein D3 [Strongylocentrotus purpuratus]|uniref:Phosphatidylethanolamine-binding protein n=1 Tax=Strongylocentrotus purpuratus TaxID=7668 RepID=A0A7M7PHI7_STRPU|nr:protein D3 [Strongylocentrotus purpuratus]